MARPLRTGRLLVRLAGRNVRARPGQAALLLVALSLATGTLSLALTLNETGDDAWDRVWRATNGPHVRAEVVAPPGAGQVALDPAAAQAALDRLATAPGVVATSGPWPLIYTTGDVGGVRINLRAEVRDPRPAAVGQPLLTAGRWLDGSGGVVLEDGLAATRQVRPGDTITVAGRRLRVLGTALTVSFGRYPMYDPGVLWVDGGVAAALRAGDADEVAGTLDLRLADPGAAAAFAAAHSGPAGPAGPGGPGRAAAEIGVETWQELRAQSHDDLSAFAVALLIVAVLLAGLTIATAAVLVAGRMAAQIRQVGTLKAVGVTPGQVTTMLLVEYLALAAVAVVLGVLAGRLLGPQLARSARSLYGAPAAPPFSWSRAGIVALVAAGAVLLATIRPALRGARQSTLRSLVTGVRRARRSSRLGRLATAVGLPLSAVLGLRLAARRPGRTIANAAGLALGVAMIVIGLTLDRAARDFGRAQRPDDPTGQAVQDAVIDSLLTILYAAAGLLVMLAAVNAVIVAAFAARDGARTHATVRALGGTPRQTIAAFLVAQLGGCVLACLVGIPLGVVLFDTFGGDDLAPARLPAASYAAVAAAAVLLYALIVATPARLLARQPVAPQLTYE